MRPWLAVALIAACRHGAAPAAPACPTAAVVITSQDQLDRLAGCARLPGLTVRGAAPFDLAALAGLETVDGDLVFGPTFALTSIGLPALTAVAGRFAVVSSAAATGVFAPRLREVGALEVRDGLSLVTLSLPALVAVRGDLTIVRLPALELLDHGGLVEVPAGAVIEVPATATRLTPAP